MCYVLWVCFCNLRYTTRKCARAILASVSCPALQYFSTLSHKGHIFHGKVVEHEMCVLIFSTSFARNISHSKKNWARYNQKCILLFMGSTHYSCYILIKLEISRHIFWKYSNIKFSENLPRGSWGVPCELTHGWQTHTTKLIVVVRNFANANHRGYWRRSNWAKILGI